MKIKENTEDQKKAKNEQTTKPTNPPDKNGARSGGGPSSGGSGLDAVEHRDSSDSIVPY